MKRGSETRVKNNAVLVRLTDDELADVKRHSGGTRSNAEVLRLGLAALNYLESLDAMASAHHDLETAHG